MWYWRVGALHSTYSTDVNDVGMGILCFRCPSQDMAHREVREVTVPPFRGIG